MRFSKISITSRGVELTRQEKNPSGDVEDRYLSSPGDPLPSFIDALQAFRPFVVTLLELPLTWTTEQKEGDELVELLTITTLNLSEDKNGLRGLIVTATRPIPKAYGKPVVLNTPLVREGGELALSDAFVLSDEVLQLIKLAEAEATRFVNGERGEAKAAKKTSENANDFADRAAAASAQSTRKPKADNTVQFPEKGSEPAAFRTPDEVRQLLLTVERDVPVEAIAAWSADEWQKAVNWATARQKELIGQADAKVPREPKCVIKAATMPLKADEWTAPTPPPSAADVETVSV